MFHRITKYGIPPGELINERIGKQSNITVTYFGIAESSYACNVYLYLCMFKCFIKEDEERLSRRC